MKAKESDLQARAEGAHRTWDPVTGGKRSWICFEDLKVYDLGADPKGTRFEKISRTIFQGNYYPPDAVRFSGAFRQEGRDLQVGDRIVQRAPLFGKLGGPLMPSVAEIYVTERDTGRCKIGYVTTSEHVARGMWSAELSRTNDRLKLAVKSIASPDSWLFWLGLPYARYLQLRARRRAVDEFRRLI